MKESGDNALQWYSSYALCNYLTNVFVDEYYLTNRIAIVLLLGRFVSMYACMHVYLDKLSV